MLCLLQTSNGIRTNHDTYLYPIKPLRAVLSPDGAHILTIEQHYTSVEVNTYNTTTHQRRTVVRYPCQPLYVDIKVLFFLLMLASCFCLVLDLGAGRRHRTARADRDRCRTANGRCVSECSNHLRKVRNRTNLTLKSSDEKLYARKNIRLATVKWLKSALKYF